MPATFDVINPATEDLAGTAPICTADELDVVMASAQRAFAVWSRDEDQRREAMRAASQLLMGAAQDIGPVLTSENGKPLPRAIEEVWGCAMWMSYFADLEVETEVVPSGGRLAEIRRRPLGVVAAIAPWNYPLVLAMWKIAPALRAGNTVVLKPSPFTPLSSIALGEMLAGVLPEGTVQVVTGGDDLGAMLSTHPAVRKISFTGSVATGKLVAAAAAPDLKRVTLELGGNDAAIVLGDVDVDEAAGGIYDKAFQNSGQVCSAIKRVYAPESRYDELVDALAARAKAAAMGDPMAEGTDLGPVANAPQYRRVVGLIDDAIDHGAVAATGGSAIDGPGYFVAPTVFRDVAEGVRIVDEEQFGPVLPVISYRDVDDAVARANDTTYGLGGSVWSSDVERALDVAGRLECGTAWVNTHLGLSPDVPFGGAKWSGIGVENGHWGLETFSEIQVLSRPA
jgi:acyl-CoA reductase-like NAD-dependent aldehyde dehydrogenase